MRRTSEDVTGKVLEISKALREIEYSVFDIVIMLVAMSKAFNLSMDELIVGITEAWDVAPDLQAKVLKTPRELQ